jgi:hypothetical protein
MGYDNARLAAATLFSKFVTIVAWEPAAEAVRLVGGV